MAKIFKKPQFGSNVPMPHLSANPQLYMNMNVVLYTEPGSYTGYIAPNGHPHQNKTMFFPDKRSDKKMPFTPSNYMPATRPWHIGEFPSKEGVLQQGFFFSYYYLILICICLALAKICKCHFKYNVRSNFKVCKLFIVLIFLC